MGFFFRDSSLSSSQSDDSSAESSESYSSNSTSSSSLHTDSLKDCKQKVNKSADDIGHDDFKSYKSHSYTKRKKEGAGDDIQDRRKRGKYLDKEKRHDDRDYGRNTKHGGNFDKVSTKYGSRNENPAKDKSQKEFHHDRSVRLKEKQVLKQDYGSKHDSYKSYNKKCNDEYAVRGSTSKQDNIKGDTKASRLKHHRDDSEYCDRKSTKEEYESRRRTGHQRTTSRGSKRSESDEKRHHGDGEYCERKSTKEEYEGRRERSHQRLSHRENKRSESKERRARHVREWDIGKSSSGNEQMEREHAERRYFSFSLYCDLHTLLSWTAHLGEWANIWGDRTL